VLTSLVRFLTENDIDNNVIDIDFDSFNLNFLIK